MLPLKNMDCNVSPKLFEEASKIIFDSDSCIDAYDEALDFLACKLKKYHFCVQLKAYGSGDDPTLLCFTGHKRADCAKDFCAAEVCFDCDGRVNDCKKKGKLLFTDVRVGDCPECDGSSKSIDSVVYSDPRSRKSSKCKSPSPKRKKSCKSPKRSKDCECEVETCCDGKVEKCCEDGKCVTTCPIYNPCKMSEQIKQVVGALGRRGCKGRIVCCGDEIWFLTIKSKFTEFYSKVYNIEGETANVAGCNDDFRRYPLREVLCREDFSNPDQIINCLKSILITTKCSHTFITTPEFVCQSELVAINMKNHPIVRCLENVDDCDICGDVRKLKLVDFTCREECCCFFTAWSK